MSLLDKLKKFEKKDTQKEPISEPQKILSVKDIKKQKIVSKKDFDISHTPTTDITEDNTIDICSTCNKRYKIIQDKYMNKDTIIDWFRKYLTKNEQNFTLDWLRGQKLTFESVNEMRK